MLVLISYDLRQQEKNYDSLYDSIKRIGDRWWHYLDSTWLVHTNLSLEDCNASLRSVIDNDDYLLIVDITGTKYQGWLPSKAWEWIRNNNY